jgi:hypothetical protein
LRNFYYSLTLGVFAFGCLGWMLFGSFERRNNQKQSTTINNKNNNLQQEQQPTQQKQQYTTKTTTHTTIKRVGRFIIALLLVFLLLLALVGFCFGALSVATINNKNNNLQHRVSFPNTYCFAGHLTSLFYFYRRQ